MKTGLALVVAAALLGSPAIARADVVLDWNAIAVSASASQGPFDQARILAITQLAVFEAVNAIVGDYQPYLGNVVAPAGAATDAAAIAAAHRVLRNYLPASAASLDAARAASLAAIPDGPAKSDGIAVGELAADEMIAARVNDGSAPPQFSLPASTDAGVWQLTPGCPAAGGVFLHWRNVTPFGIASAADFLADPPPALDSNLYAKGYDEVKRVGRIDSTERSTDRANVARFYAQSSPAYVINLAARQLSIEKGSSLSENARAFALIDMAISDATVATFNTKYHYDRWRPETAIQNGAADGNPETEADTAWHPFIVAPCFPSYSSNHAGASYAGAEILRRLYGAGGHAIVMSNPNIPGLVFQYAELKDLTADIDDARVYGGIHFRFDQDAGARLGRDVATAVHKDNLRPLSKD